MDDELTMNLVKRRTTAVTGGSGSGSGSGGGAASAMASAGTSHASGTAHDRAVLCTRGGDAYSSERGRLTLIPPITVGAHTASSPTASSGTATALLASYCTSAASLSPRTHTGDGMQSWLKSVHTFMGGGTPVHRRVRVPRVWRRRPLRCTVALVLGLLVAALVALSLLHSPAVTRRIRRQRRLLDMTALEPLEDVRDDGVVLSALVQHDDAVGRLPPGVAAQETCPSSVPAPERGDRDAGDACVPVRLNATLLPAWTLRVVRRGCKDCLDTHTYKSAVAGVELRRRHGVFATSAAPLGRIGPMVLAMASVTDDVDVRVELPQWAWLRHVYGDTFPTAGSAAEASPGGAAAAGAPYLAVMGIPSTDQRARVALRDAQRRTWLSYQEVARNDNQFRGALLTLYVFAAVEPAPIDDGELSTLAGDGGAEWVLDGEEENTNGGGGAATSPTSTTTVPETLSVAARNATAAATQACCDVELLLPTVAEYARVSEELLAAQRKSRAPRRRLLHVRRRVALRSAWATTATHTSPCGAVESDVTGDRSAATTLTYLAQSLSLPVTPAFTAPARFICYASSALWQEALTHRNAVWIDMLTDRTPTTDKKLGDTTKWGLPVEVGMSQKLILWLDYAYHAFPTVPFIIKGDDDTYVKVPQFLSDVRYVRHGVQRPRLPPPPALASQREDDEADTLRTYEPQTVMETKCLYWGSTRRLQGMRFNAGMMFMLHRHVALMVLEPPQSRQSSGGSNGDGEDYDLPRIAAQDFSYERKRLYKRSTLQYEDILIGVTLQRRRARAQALCEDGTVWYVKENIKRFHDLHRGKMHDVTWSTVVAHRCTPADTYYLHHYFQTAHLLAAPDSADSVALEAAAAAAAAEWAAEQQAELASDVTGWEDLPAVSWMHNKSAVPGVHVAAGDSVPVFNTRYLYWQDNNTHTFNGYKSCA